MGPRTLLRASRSLPRSSSSICLPSLQRRMATVIEGVQKVRKDEIAPLINFSESHI